MMNYTPYHGVQDKTKLAALIESMRANGWQGCPLVADGDQLITGAHRYQAARKTETSMQVVDIRDVYPEWDSLMEEYDYPTSDSPEYVAAVCSLPATLRTEYGIDLE